MSRSTDRSIASALTGSAFLMATSAIGPGFITQTTVFTSSLGASFGFVILCSVIIDIIVQLNIWRIVAVSGLRAQDLANRTVRGSGHLLTVLIVLGGLAFNIGNVAGAGLGIQVLTGLDLSAGVIISVIISLGIFIIREAGRAMDIFAKILGVVMVGLTAFVAFRSQPPVGEAISRSFAPLHVNTAAIMVLVGGTVGGYISFAGVHRLIDAGVTGPENIRNVSRASVRAILLAALMRILLFLAALGVVSAGVALHPDNPPASVFRSAAGEIGYRIFGIVLWAASITSVVGSAYTSVSFLRTTSAVLDRNHRWVTIGFIVISCVVFLLVGRPIQILIVVGALNAIVLPFGLAILLLAARRRMLVGEYRHPFWMYIAGWVAVALLAAMMAKTLIADLGGFWK